MSNATVDYELGGDWDLPWYRRRQDPNVELPHLVLLWYWQDPARSGEVAVIRKRSVLGRAPLDGHAVQWIRQRPGHNQTRPALADPRLSRLQLELSADGDTVVVVNRGRRELLVDGLATPRATVKRGTVLTVRDVAVLLVEWRQEVLPRGRHVAALLPEFEFGRADTCGLVGESPAAWRLREQLAGAASQGGHTLVFGESGSGKELAARLVHALSDRRGGPLVSRNAATIPDGLFDAEVFGNAKNYPNPGMPERVGLIGQARGGTLILDEVGELTEARQAHLLRVLDAEGEYQRLGESRVRRSDFRMVALTNRPLSCLKHDFLARFATRIEVPSLRERRADTPLVLRASWSEWCRYRPEERARLGTGTAGSDPLLEPLLVDLLSRHSHPENFRGLRRLFQVALATSDAEYVGATRALLAELAPGIASAKLDRHRVEAALERHPGRPTKAAQELGLKNRFALYRAMERLGVQPAWR